MHRFLPFAVSVALLVPGFASAQSGTGAVAETPTDTAATLRVELSTLRLRGTTQPKVRTDIVWADASRAVFTQDRRAVLERKALRRAECAMELRRSNRDTLLRTALECFKADLTDDLTTLRKDDAMLKRLPGLSDTRRTETLKQLTALSDAIQTVVDAIDSDVYDAVDELHTARTKLTAQYWLPYRKATLHANAERLMSWASLSALRIEQLVDLEPGPEAEEHLLEAVRCLDLAFDKYDQLLSIQEYQNAVTSFGQLKSALLECSKPVRVAHRLVEPPDPLAGSGTNTKP